MGAGIDFSHKSVAAFDLANSAGACCGDLASNILVDGQHEMHSFQYYQDKSVGCMKEQSERVFQSGKASDSTDQQRGIQGSN